MVSMLRVDGTWPGQLILSNAWGVAHVRPWNDEISDPVVRLERGGVGFVRAVVEHMARLGAGHIYSPALFPGSTRVWSRAGFEDHVRLEVMERAITTEDDLAVTNAVQQSHPSWSSIVEIDRQAFHGFWRMSELGLADAFATSRSSTVITIGEEELSGYALLGAQWGTAYLHRIAVRPDKAGQGVGRELLQAAASWGRRWGTKSMILNVRNENDRAKRLYEKFGFAYTGTDLTVLRNTPESEGD